MRKILLMTGVGLAILIVLGAGWQYAGAYYNRFIALCAHPFLADPVTLTAQGAELHLNYSKDQLLGIRSLSLYYGALLVTALILGTLVCSWGRRALAVAITWVGFSAVSIITVAMMSWGFKWTIEGGPTNLNEMGPVMTLSYIGIPALVCAWWCVKYWFPVMRQDRSAATRAKRP